MERVSQEIFNPEGSVESSGDTNINVYWEDKHRSLSQGETPTLVEVSEESIAEILGGLIVSERIVDQSMLLDVVGDREEGGQEYLSSTPVKSASGVGIVADSSKVPSESPLKRPARVAFTTSEEEELVCEIAHSRKRKRKTNDGDGTRISTSTGGLTTDIQLSEMGEMIGQGF